MTIESRNARTMRSAQWAYDNMAPADDCDVRDNLTEDDYAEARESLIEQGCDPETITDEDVEAEAVAAYIFKWTEY